jgi:hypothetical protein
MKPSKNKWHNFVYASFYYVDKTVFFDLASTKNNLVNLGFSSIESLFYTFVLFEMLQLGPAIVDEHKVKFANSAYDALCLSPTEFAYLDLLVPYVDRLVPLIWKAMLKEYVNTIDIVESSVLDGDLIGMCDLVINEISTNICNIRRIRYVEVMNIFHPVHFSECINDSKLLIDPLRRRIIDIPHTIILNSVNLYMSIIEKIEDLTEYVKNDYIKEQKEIYLSVMKALAYLHEGILDNKLKDYLKAELKNLARCLDELQNRLVLNEYEIDDFLRYLNQFNCSVCVYVTTAIDIENNKY